MNSHSIESGGTFFESAAGTSFSSCSSRAIVPMDEKSFSPFAVTLASSSRGIMHDFITGNSYGRLVSIRRSAARYSSSMYLFSLRLTDAHWRIVSMAFIPLVLASLTILRINRIS